MDTDREEGFGNEILYWREFMFLRMICLPVGLITEAKKIIMLEFRQWLNA